MKSHSMITAALAAVLLLAGCAKPQEEAKEELKAEAPAIDLAAEEQAIRTRSAEWMNYANSKEVATIVNEVYTPDAIVIYDGNVRRGSAEIQASAEKDMAASPNSVISWTTTDVRVASSGDMALETGDVVIDVDGEGKKPATTGSFVTVWVKVDGKWRAVADAGTDDAKAEAPAP